MPHLALAPGTRLGVYDVTAQIGEGGMGQVYRARDTRLDRMVAVKMLAPALASEDFRVRFADEAKAISADSKRARERSSQVRV